MITAEKIQEKYPRLYGKGVRCGFSCPEGWLNLVEELSASIDHFLENWVPKNKTLEVTVEQVKEKFGCYDEKTEVLTKDGWKYFKDISYDDKIASLVSGKYIEYHNPSDIIKYHYTGDMYRLKTRGVDLLVTPNHNLYLSKGSYYNGRHSPSLKKDYDFELCNPKKYFGKNKRFKKSGIWLGKKQDVFNLPKDFHEWKHSKKVWPEKKIEMDLWLKFLGWYIAEGCASVKKGDVRIACNNTDGGLEKNVIGEIISNIGFKLKTSGENKSAFTFNIYSKRLAKWLSKNCGQGSLYKKVPSFVKELCPEQIIIFLNSLYQGDGHKSKTAETLYTISKQLSDDVQELLLKAGYTSSVDIRPPAVTDLCSGKHNCYCIRWLKKSNFHNTSNKKKSISTKEKIVPYKGMVYCVTVPEHVIYVRRGGKPVWCGNSLRFYADFDYDLEDPELNHLASRIRGMIDFAESLSFKVCEVCGSPGKTMGKSYLRTLCEKHSGIAIPQDRKRKGSVSLDFDGVINSYASGFVGIDKLPDPPVAGAIEYIQELIDYGFKVYVYSTRNEQERGRVAISKYLLKHGLPEEYHKKVGIVQNKPKCKIYLDDRAWEFTGKFPSPMEIDKFLPWTKRVSSSQKD